MAPGPRWVAVRAADECAPAHTVIGDDRRSDQFRDARPDPVPGSMGPDRGSAIGASAVVGGGDILGAFGDW